MFCPRCNTRDTRVIDSRIARQGLSIRRRRECVSCGYRFSTGEEIIREDLMVLKRDGRREAFDRNKIVAALRRACHKRPVDPEQIELLTSDVLLLLESRFELEIPARAIGEILMEKLKNIDKIAYVRFASVYKDFRDIEEFTAEIDRLKADHESPDT